MNLLRSLRFALHACASGFVLVALWTLWLALAGALGLQIWVLTRRQLELPDFALRAIERRLTTPDIMPKFGRAVFDPTGRLLLTQVELFGPDRSTPLVTIRAAYASLEFLPLLIGEIRVHEIRFTGLNLRVPAMVSPSGADESVVSDLDGIFRVHRPDYDIDLCTFHVAGVAIAGRGAFHLPSVIHSRPSSLPILDLVLDRYLKAGRKLVALQPKIESLNQPHLQLTLAPDSEAGAIVNASLLIDASRPDAPCNVDSVRAHAVFPLLGDAPVSTLATIDVRRASWKGQARVDRLHVALTGQFVPNRFAFTPQTAQLAASRADAMGLSINSPAAELNLAKWPRLKGRAILEAAGAPLLAHGNVETRRGDGTIDVTTSLTPEMLRLASSRFGLKASQWVTLSEPASVKARVDLAEGWKPARVEGDISVRHAIAHDVPIDAAGGHVVYAGHGIDVTDLTLFQGENAAYGSYAMDTRTMEYRFLLRGHLRPLDISGWFKDWWPDFWRSFDFAAAPPVANVDVAGRWGTAKESVVFCNVDAIQPGIRGVPFDRVRTTLFFRPDFFEVSAFKAERAGREAHGSFTVAVDPDNSTYRTLDFDAVSNLDIAECARLYGRAGVTLAAPFQFTAPPKLRLVGHLDGPAVPGGRHSKIHFTIEADNRLTVYGFPLDTMGFSADYHDNDLDLQNAVVGFAGGRATGSMRIEGPQESRKLAFEVTLADANLARTISIFNGFQSGGQAGAHKPPADGLLRRTSTGRIDGRLSANGLLNNPFRFHGDGHVAVTGQELGEIHLLGMLSEMLNKNPLLNFTSLRLDTAQANFRIEGDKIAFPQMKLQGPRTAIDAKGDYLLTTKTLDFNARIYPLQRSKVAVADALGALLTPLSNVLELKLTGPLEKPSWSFTYGPTNILRAITRPLNNAAAPAGGTPAPASASSPAPRKDFP